jgi:hypothetical protein
MKPAEEPRPGNDNPPSKPTRSEIALQVIQEYANNLREWN